MLVPAGRLAALKKPGWPKVSRSFRSCEYDNVNTAFELTSAVERVWLFNTWPRYDPKPTSNVTVMLFVNVESRILMAVCSSWRKLLICAWVNGPSVVKSLLTWICMACSSRSHREAWEIWRSLPARYGSPDFTISSPGAHLPSP